MINWEVTPKEFHYIEQIARRAIDLKLHVDVIHVQMNITACHNHGCPLSLKKLLKADDFTFVHDIVGIDNHIDRETGELKYFVPRCARKE